ISTYERTGGLLSCLIPSSPAPPLAPQVAARERSRKCEEGNSGYLRRSKLKDHQLKLVVFTRLWLVGFADPTFNHAPFHLPDCTLALLLFMHSLAIHRHEEVIQRLSQRGMCKDAVANNGIRQLPHHGDLQYRHHFTTVHAKDRAT